jgi:hypothetical protein
MGNHAVPNVDINLKRQGKFLLKVASLNDFELMVKNPRYSTV